ncbi:MAG TPA: Trm112 family protein [Streptosporangiaceae bacterium]|nr:Trm112 family protein [Streptosporangiaceae bacterium]
MNANVPIEQPLLDILACPIDKQGLLFFAGDSILYNPRLRRIYRLADGYPVMLADRAEPASEEEHQRLLKRAAHGEAVGTSGCSPQRISEEPMAQGQAPAADRR